MDAIELGCKIVGGLGVMLVGLSMMWVCGLMIFSGGVPGPPRTLFVGLFAIMGSGMIWFAAKLLIDGRL